MVFKFSTTYSTLSSSIIYVNPITPSSQSDLLDSKFKPVRFILTVGVSCTIWGH